MKDMSPVVLVDGSSYLFRAFHALPRLTNSKGRETGAIRGVIAMLRKLRDDYPDGRMIVVFDARGGSFRDQLYTQYKANRPSMADELREQIQPIHDIIRLMGIPLLIVEGVEADDVIGTLARQAEEEQYHVIISTGDKDLAQLVSDRVHLINTMNNTLLDVQGVMEKFGVKPGQIVDYLSLIGDTSDNIPGVPKVGPKTAAKWLQEYGSLDAVLAAADGIKGKVGENLRASFAQLSLAKQLVTIVTEVDLPAGLQELKATEPATDELRTLFTELEFRTWLEEFREEDESADELTVTQLKDLEGLDAWLPALAQDQPVALAVVAGTEQAGCLALAQGDAVAAIQFQTIREAEGVAEMLGSLFAELTLVGHDLKKAIHQLSELDIDTLDAGFDIMLESYVLNSTGSKHRLEDLALACLDQSLVSEEELLGKGARKKPLSSLGPDQVCPWVGSRAMAGERIHRTLWPRLADTPTLGRLFTDLEMPLLGVLAKVERQGVLVDAGLLRQQSEELALRLERLETSAFELAGEAFNLASPKQLQQLLFDKLGLPILRKTQTGQPSTAEEVLQELAHDFPLPQIIMQHRALSKLKSTYTDQLPLQVHSDSRIHTTYHQAVAATGRLSSADPNLQNIPIRTKEGRRVRQAFISPPGYQLIAADYSQIELRIMAHLSADPGLMQAFAEGQDVHRTTAAEVFGMPLAEVTNDQRRSAKAINFGLIYGMSAFGLARQLAVSRVSAQDYINRYFDRYPGVRDYMERTRHQAAETGYVETLFGRRLYLPEINSRNIHRKQAAERTAINAPMQGTAADIIKRAMLGVDAELALRELKARMIMQVHDELVLEVPDEELEQVRELVCNCMLQAAELSVPLEVETGTGENWDTAH